MIVEGSQYQIKSPPMGFELFFAFELAPANEYDLRVRFELLSEHTDLQVLGIKSISAESTPFSYDGA